MPNIESILQEINKELTPQFEEKLRAYLADQDKDWLIEQIIRLTLDAHSLQEKDRQHIREEKKRKLQERAKRVQELNLDEQKLAEFVNSYQGYTRDRLIQKNLLLAGAPSKGTGLITNDFRTAEGNQLLQYAKDMLFALLYGDESNTQVPRTQRELLTLTIPRAKAETLDFMKSRTELHATGTWQESNSSATERQVENVVLEIEYGETEKEKIGDGIITALTLINNLEINEKILYGRMEKVEQSTLVS
jgi:hypothetical protein